MRLLFLSLKSMYIKALIFTITIIDCFYASRKIVFYNPPKTPPDSCQRPSERSWGVISVSTYFFNLNMGFLIYGIFNMVFYFKKIENMVLSIWHLFSKNEKFGIIQCVIYFRIFFNMAFYDMVKKNYGGVPIIFLLNAS